MTSFTCFYNVVGFVVAKPKFVILPFLLMQLSALAQEVSVTLPVPASNDSGLFSVAAQEAKGNPVLLQPLYWVKTIIDSSAVATVDRKYIEQPKKAFSVELRNEFSECFLKMTTDYPLQNGNIASMDVRMSTGFNASTGLWAGYRGYGFGYSKNLMGNGSTISFGAMGGSFGLNLRINSYRSDTPEVGISLESTKASYNDIGIEELDDPIKVRSLFLDGYYMFNGKHFSYAAAYDQSLIQKRSAGSLMAGAMYYHSRVSLDEPYNWPLMTFMRGVGKIKFTQASVGLGYAYNWVPAKGWLISAQAMPMLQFYNKMKTYVNGIYYFNPYLPMPIDLIDLIENNIEEILLNQADDNDYGDNGDYSEDLIVVTEPEEYRTNNKIGLNFDARLSVVYNWKNFYLRVYGHYNRFRYSNDTGHGRMSEWRAYASLGFRF